MSEVKRWYFGSYGGRVLALNRTDEQEIDEDAPHDFVLGSDYDASEQRNAELLEILRSLRLNASPRLFSIGQLAQVDEALKIGDGQWI